MAGYYIAALGLTRAEDLYVSFRRLMRSEGVCWPLPWAGTWSEAAVMQDAAELNDGAEVVAVSRDAVHALATAPTPGRINGDVGPVVRNSAANSRALVLAARRDIVSAPTPSRSRPRVTPCRATRASAKRSGCSCRCSAARRTWRTTAGDGCGRTGACNLVVG